MSELLTNKITPTTGTAITLGDSGDTLTVPVGATLAVAGAATVGTSLAVAGTSTVGGVSVVATAPGTSGNVLTSTGSAWASSAVAAGGKVLQVVHTVKTDTFSTSTTGSWVDVTGLTVTTGSLASTGSKVLVQVTMNAGSTADYANARVVDGSGNFITGFGGDAAGGRHRASFGTFYRGADGGGNIQLRMAVNLYDSPGSTSAQTYKVQTYSNGILYINRSVTDADNTSIGRSVSTISVMEIGV